jgi:chromosomal replication initiator protein
MDIATALHSALAEKVGRKSYDLWFGPQTRLELHDGTVAIYASNNFFLDWIRRRFRRSIESACEETFRRPMTLEFHLDPLPGPTPAAGAASPSPAMSSPCPAPAAETANTASPADMVAPADTAPTTNALSAADTVSPTGGTWHTEAVSSTDGTSRTSAAGAAPGDASRPRRTFHRLESFVVGPTNRLAYAAAEQMLRRPGEVSPLVIYGPTGLGKTHLLEGIWTAARRSSRSATAIYLSAEQFVTGFLQALRGGGGMPNFRRKYRDVDLLLIDDLQFFSGKHQTQIELLYTIDSLERQRRQLVFASDRAPSELGDLGPELIARLQSGLTCRIEQPDCETRRRIVAQMAERLGLTIGEEVVQWIASRLTRHARELSGALCKLQAVHRAWGKPISVAMAEEALAEMIRDGSRVVRLPDIEKAVCEALDLDAASLHSPRKSKSVSYPRMLAMWLARKYTRSALTEIGHYFGHRSHSTVISAQRRVDQWLARGAAVALADRTWEIDDAIRHIERRLHAG